MDSYVRRTSVARKTRQHKEHNVTRDYRDSQIDDGEGPENESNQNFHISPLSSCEEKVDRI